MDRPSVLIVTTSHSRMGETNHQTGVWAEELATPYYALIDGGADVTIASIAGGAVPFDPRSLPAESGTDTGEEPAHEQEIAPSVLRLLSDQSALDAIMATPSIEQVETRACDAIFLPGGHGTMWDFPDSEALARLVGQMFDEGKIVAAVCHGPAGLVAAKRSDGRPIVEGRRVNGFTNTEEDGVGLSQVVPFLLEDRLKELGGRFERGPDWQPFAVRDGNLITGQNPQSSKLVARNTLSALELAAVPA
jgi:putative intracellular protease/amidase